VASYGSQSAAFAAVHRQHGRIDALVANAGVVEDGPSLYQLSAADLSRAVSDPPPEPSTRCTDVDYKGVLYGLYLSVHYMRHNRPRPGGRVVATASVTGVVAHPGFPQYNGAKAAVVSLCRGSAGVLAAHHGVRFNVVCPGIVVTNIIPGDVLRSLEPRHRTPVSTVVRAYDGFLDAEDRRCGVVVEANGDKVLEVEEPRLPNGEVSVRSVTVWEPLFKILHGAESGLEGTIH
jgi:NAD(P)-dependent dehydrogenase (short-subunit alcohol dehydrogenase family)